MTLSNPRRRRFLGGLAVLVLVLAAGFLIGRSRSSSGATTSAAAPGPVILVPGYGGGTDSLEVLAVRLRAAGHTVSILQLAGDGTGDLQVQAKRLKAAVDALVAAGAPSVDVVGYSAGGVVTRLWAGELGGAAHARRIVLLGSPNHGTAVAALGAAFGGSVCPTACKQLTPDSALLARLNQEDTPAGPQWVSMWTDQDEVVTPPDSARLDGAASFTVQSVCADAQVDHGTLPTNKVVEGLVVRALADAPFEQPGPQDCAAVSS